jgi:hypothetical protein
MRQRPRASGQRPAAKGRRLAHGSRPSNRGQNRAACSHTGPRYQGESLATGEPPGDGASGNGFEVPGGRFEPAPVVGFEVPRFEPVGVNGSPRQMSAPRRQPRRRVRRGCLPWKSLAILPSISMAFRRLRCSWPSPSSPRFPGACRQVRWHQFAAGSAGQTGLRRCAPVRRIRNGSRHGPGNRSRWPLGRRFEPGRVSAWFPVCGSPTGLRSVGTRCLGCQSLPYTKNRDSRRSSSAPVPPGSVMTQPPDYWRACAEIVSCQPPLGNRREA